MRYFKDIDAIRNASAEELDQVPQMNRKAAEAVYLFFHKRKTSQEAGLLQNTQGAELLQNT